MGFTRDFVDRCVFFNYPMERGYGFRSWSDDWRNGYESIEYASDSSDSWEKQKREVDLWQVRCQKLVLKEQLPGMCGGVRAVTVSATPVKKPEH